MLTLQTLPRLFLLFVFSFYFSCSGLLVRDDYHPSLSAWADGNAEETLKKFPSGENGSFITILEKSHISFLAGGSDFKDLEEQAEKSKERLRFSASRELKSFFYLETEEGYYASEAEIIYMHILLGLYYVRTGNYEKGKVQARYAGNLLSGEWSAEGQFDDPVLRVLLASLWTSLGHWEEARVDLKVAAHLSPKSKILRTFAQSSVPPKEFLVLLGGLGGEPYPSAKANINLIRGMRGLDFVFSGKKSETAWIESGNKPTEGPLYLESETHPWYDRHLTRDNAIHELIEDSKYFQRVTASALKEGAKGTAKITAAVTTGAVVIALGAGVAYLGAKGNSGDGVGLGVAIMFAGLKLGYDWSATAIQESSDNFSKDVDISREYRYVRFLPEYLWLGSSVSELSSPGFKTNGSSGIKTFGKPMGKNKVRFGFHPDSKR
ncbi:hypothetical protein [Leptospira idonii]|uniref:Tetratricopeptide repeat protein n=1 Tax=Leptospira idonii TaxID=1193500 RepID=A0A4R9M261_9LEPT|nr:hypothetical protein [Leptospira idonii]TGN20192.1 hypothetical protein EHS15_05750 [Leptospira idonii]